MEEIIKEILLEVPGEDDNKVQRLINKSIVQIRLYLNKNFSNEYIVKSFKYAIEQIVIDTLIYQKTDQYKSNISKIQQGARSIEYKSLSENGRVIFSEEVKSMLPTPYVTLMG
ncbi:MAG: hypothetical protein ACRC1T_16945 [Clostridium chrysemydis]|uniref:hypothetical protein n=1 Tax=Clostridium TaxID=1485 RepID=UPI002152F0A5|nr:hypothetical protein [Clostridium sp. LY3-2]MCR6516323.1 hypothetical protein [Clostridium sp. LY3-2]